MAKLNQITIGGKLYIEVNANPVGLQAPVGSAAVWNNGGVGKYFFKNGVSDTAWEEIPTLSALEKLVSDEATARDAAISSAVSAEATARDAAIAVEATARARADLAEITDRKAEDAKLQKAIDDEVLARQTADESLQDQIDAEVLARKAADEALSKIKTFSSTQSYLKDQFVYVDGATAETFNGGSGIYFAKQDITAGAFNDSQWQYAGTPFDTKDGLSFSIDVGANGTLTIGINDNGIAPEKIQSLPISKVTGLQSELDKKMDKAGGTMTGDLNMGEKKITNVSVIEGKKVTTGVAPINGMQVTVGSFRFADGTRWDGSLLFTYRNDVRFNQKVFSYLHSQVEGGPNAWDIFHAAFPTATDFSTDRGLLSIYDINNNKVCEVTYAGTGYIVNSWMAQDNAMNLIEGYGAYDNNFTMIDSQSVVETPVAFSTGIDAGGKVVKNVGPAISDTDAINKAQLTSAINSVSDGAGESVAQEVSDRIAADTDLKSELQTDYNAKFDLTASAQDLFDEVAARTAADLAEKNERITEDAKKLDLAGGTMTGDLNMGEKKITNVSVIEGKKVTTGVAPINGMQVTVGSFRFADGTRWDGSLLFTYRNDVRFNQKVFSYLHSQVEGGPNAWDIFHAAFPTATDFSTDRGLLSIYDINNNKVCEVTYAGTGYIVNSWMAQDNAMNLIEGYGAYDNNFTMIDSQSVVETPVAFSTGIDAGGKVVKNVGPAISDTDAINKAQLTSAINSVSDGAGESVAQEVSDRIAADTDLKSELQTDYNAKFDLTASAKELFDEVAARKAADAILQGSINALSNNLNWRPGCIAATADADLASAVDGTVLSTLLPFSDDAAPIMDASGFKAGQFIVCKNGSSSKVFKIVSGSSTSIMTKETMGTNNAGVFYYMQYELGNPNYSLTAAEYSSIQVGDSVTASGNGSPVVVTTVESKAIVFDGVSGQNQYVITLTEKTGWQSPTFLAFTISSNALQVTTVGVEVPKVGDAFIVQNDFPASPNENETVAVYSFSGSDMVRIGTFAWNLATGINLNTFVASPGLVITGDTIQAAIQKLVGNLEAEITARQNAINTEITAREAAIAVEATARADADLAEITAREAAIAVEATARADADLAEITAREAAIAVEATARAAADLAEITARNAAIASNAWHLEIVGNVDSSLELAVSGQAVEQKYFETMYASAISPFSDISVDRKSEVSIERKSKLVATLRFYAELKISGVTKVLSFKKTFTSKDDVVLLVQDEYTQEDIDLIGANLSISVSSEGNYTTVSATITGLPTFDEGTLWGMMHLDTLAR